MNKNYYGPHLMVDILAADPGALGDLTRVSAFLGSLPDSIGMHRLTPPIAFPYHPGGDPLDPEAGITGIVVIAESHLSLHTYPHQGKAYFDAFSCRPFDPRRVLDLLIREFLVTDHRHYLVRRGSLAPTLRAPGRRRVPAPSP